MAKQQRHSLEPASKKVAVKGRRKLRAVPQKVGKKRRSAGMHAPQGMLKF
jgi:hypothetical protein